MKKLFLLLLLSISNVTFADDKPIDKQPVNSSMTKMEKKVRLAAVKVTLEDGHGSGSLIKYKGSQFVITANHVIATERYFFGMPVHVIGINETKTASLIYFDEQYDIAVLYLPKTEHFTYTQPMKWKPVEKIPPIGTLITYSGYPSWHDLMTFRGRVAGYEKSSKIGTQIILNVYGWFGSSGALVYTTKGEIVGVLWAIDVEKFPTTQVNEDIVWTVPIENLNMAVPMKILCDSFVNKIKNCE